MIKSERKNTPPGGLLRISCGFDSRAGYKKQDLDNSESCFRIMFNFIFYLCAGRSEYALLSLLPQAYPDDG